MHKAGAQHFLFSQMKRMNEELLEDYKLWNAATNQEREAIVDVLLETQLGADFEYKGIQEFSSGKQSHKIAVFLHQPSQMPFHLIPGIDIAGDVVDVAATIIDLQEILEDAFPGSEFSSAYDE